ncbi:peptidoglycan DD-metalloendopeptidase family protein [Ascidiaceihabitans sp.]|uniref:peptidoglycan DD-metalloendopeptidase family protein n=1 Tax=Ascidiaceihabitans sp. TaxID=1872644 RepID=UPI00329A1C5A
MTHVNSRRSVRTSLFFAVSGLMVLSACDEPLDFDLRGIGGGFTTKDAAVNATAKRPSADNRGVISYPNYQVAIAKRGDTLNDVAARLGLDANELARFNGVAADVPLRKDEIIALPRRVSEPSPATGAATTGPIRPSSVDVTTLAGSAIDNAPDTTPVQTATLPDTPKPSGVEPIRHKVERGETAYTIARLYQVPVRSLAEWNGLGSDFAVREGQFLLIPVAKQAPPARVLDDTSVPGAGSATPTPPSATKPLPDEDTTPAAAKPEPAPAIDVGAPSKAATNARLVYPVKGSIIREYAKGRNEGINIKAAPGTSVKAADAGTVAAITKSGDGVPIVVVRHADNLLTVYANVTDVQVQKGDTVRRGQGIAKLRDGDQSFVHFEVRKGFDSVDPTPYLQ